jgi:hypothetical protein
VAGPADRIADFLTTSLSAYTSATKGSWVRITSNEYTSLSSNISNTSIAGANSNVITAIGTDDKFWNGPLMFTNIVSSNTPAIPANSYLYAVQFRYNTANSNVQVYANDSTTSYTNFSQVGSDLPVTTSGYNYYVLKGASNTTASTDGNFAMWQANNFYQAWLLNVGGAGVRYKGTLTGPAPGPSLIISSNFASSSAFAMQALTTTSKQW